MAQDMNSVVLVGRLVRDAEINSTSSGKTVVKFSIAVGGYKDKTSFIDCESWNAEKIQSYLVKGKMVCVKGELEQQSWEKDGQKRSKVIVKVDRLQFIGGTKTESKPASFEDDTIPF